jgi:iron complex outermembrane receptor protein
MTARAALALGSAMFSFPVLAQTLPEGLSEIVVTAQRREESLQQTPISVSVLSAQQLSEFGVRDCVDYAKSIPNMSFGMGGSPFGGPAYGYSSTRQIVIRGIAGANTTSLYIDDTPIPNVVDPRVFDLERIEVLRGPQGTLFGASSMGGTVRLITKTADAGSTHGNVDLQTFDVDAGGGGYDVSGSVNVPLVAHDAAFSLSVFDSFNPGYFTRVFGVANILGVDFSPGTQVSGSTKVGDTRQYGGSASFRITPATIPGLSIVPLVMLQRSDINGYPLAEDNADNFTQVRPFNVPERSVAQWQFYAITAKYSAAFGDLIASTSYFHRYSQDVEDVTMWLAYYQSYYYSPLPYIAGDSSAVV